MLPVRIRMSYWCESETLFTAEIILPDVGVAEMKLNELYWSCKQIKSIVLDSSGRSLREPAFDNRPRI